MKKNNLLILFLSFLVIGLTGCDDNAKPTPDTNTEYTVTFDAGTGGTLTSAATVKVKSGEKVAEPTDPTRDGFTFVEWRKTGATAAFNFATETITADITLTAQWGYTVTFAGEGVTTAAQTVPDGGMATRPTTDPTRDGFTFVEWYKDTMFNELYDFSTAVTVDITVYAKWLSNTKYTVTFEPNQGLLAGGNDNNTVQISEGEKLPKPTDPTRDGFTFVEWQKEDDTAFDFDAETITANITLTAQWTRDFRMLTEIDTPSSLLRQWMQRATTQAQISNDYIVFSGGVGGITVPDQINLYIDEMPTLEMRVRPDPPYLSSQAGIPSTGNNRRSIGSTNLFGTDKTADSYAVSEDTLFITQNQATLAIMVINSTEKAIFVKAGDAPGLLLYSDKDGNPGLIDDWVAHADLAAGAHTYTGASSTVLNGSGEPVPSTLGVGSTLKFFVNTAGNSVDSIQFTQSNTSADSISGIISGTIAVNNDISKNSTPTKWPRKDGDGDATIANQVSRVPPLKALYIQHIFVRMGLKAAVLIFIEVLSRGGDLKVIFTSARNATTPAEEVTVTYRRPSSN